MKKMLALAISSFLTVLLLMAPGTAQAQDSIREDAKVLGLFLEQTRSEIAEFTRLRDALAKLRTDRINQRELLTLETRQDIEMQLYLLGIGDARERRLAQEYEKVRKGSQIAMQHRADLEARILANKKLSDDTKSAMDIEVDKLGKASRSLVQLSEPPSTMEEVLFYIDFVKKTKARVDELQTEAKESLKTEEGT